MEKITDQLQARRAYSIPEITTVKLDNEISLVLESAPPVFPGEGKLLIPEHLVFDPFKL